MGIYSEYLDKTMNFDEMTKERKIQLKKISKIRGGRDILVYASDQTKNNAPISIDYSDLLPFSDQVANLNGEEIDIILETPGGFAEVVEDMVKLVRQKYKKVGIIIPGYCKSAGTIFSMAGDEILMGKMSALGPIDAQIMSNSKRFSAEAFLEGLDKIKEEIDKTKKLHPAYIPMLQNISPGEIQHCQNAQEFSQQLVWEWLTEYKFKYWDTHKSTGERVTSEEKVDRAKEIADTLCKQSEWLTHGRSIKISDLERMRLEITDYSKEDDLNDAITRYYTLLRMSFDTNIYKIIETSETQIYRFAAATSDVSAPPVGVEKANLAVTKIKCPKCANEYSIQLNLGKKQDLQPGCHPYPLENDTFICPNCSFSSNLKQMRLQIEAQSKKKVS